MNVHPATSTLSVRILSKTRDQLDQLSDVTGRTKSFLASEAIENYLAVQSWQIKAIEEAVQLADSKDAKWIEHDQMVEWLNSWGTENEKECP
jgi:RHH-type rel operon transcriptional repressor/antitoxin RelB